jgi:phage terminase large subunit-like protein
VKPQPTITAFDRNGETLVCAAKMVTSGSGLTTCEIAYYEHRADTIVGETNNGGEMVCQGYATTTNCDRYAE